MSSLAGRRALVTGASSGIGRAIALALAERKARVALVGRDEQRLAKAVRAAQAAGATEAIPIRADLTQPAALENLEAQVREGFGGVDVLIHSSGVIAYGTVASGRLEDLDAQLSANVRAPYRLTQILLPGLIESRGEIVFVNSSVVSFPRADASQFSASQHALRGLADCLRQEVNPYGVRVLSIFPGRTATPRQERLYALEGRGYQPAALLQAEDVAAAICSALELPRTAEVTEIHIRPLQKG